MANYNHRSPARCLPDRWTGETLFLLVEGHPAAQAVKSSAVPSQETSAEPRDQAESSGPKTRARATWRFMGLSKYSYKL